MRASLAKEIGIIEARVDAKDPHRLVIVYDRRHFSPNTLMNAIELEGARVSGIQIVEQ